MYHVYAVLSGNREGVDPLGLGLLTVVSCHIDAADQMLVLWKSSQCFYLPSKLFVVFFFDTGSYCVSLANLELYVDKASLELKIFS